MGILAFCPRGHRVKVKDELAGRKGICPHCQARFRIPVPGIALPVARVVSIDAARAARLPRAEVISGERLQSPGSPPPKPRSDDVPAEAFEPLDVDSESHDSEVSAANSDPAGLHPALAERADLAWCVAIPGGDPSPPFSAAALAAWLESGAATGDEVVWRADWTDWKPIRTVFPGFWPGDDPGAGGRGPAADRPVW